MGSIQSGFLYMVGMPGFWPGFLALDQRTGGEGWGGVKSLTSSATLGPAHSHPPSQHISHKLVL